MNLCPCGLGTCDARVLAAAPRLPAACRNASIAAVLAARVALEGGPMLR